ncbi:MAG: hypothetical protein ACKVIX_06905 [Sphingomonadales bacterium]|jgi:hypothetical protein
MALNLEKKYGPLTLRAWGLVANFGANALVLYGVANLLKSNGGMAPFILGTILTIALILILAKPPND